MANGSTEKGRDGPQDPSTIARDGLRKVATKWTSLRKRSMLIFRSGTEGRAALKVYEAIRGQHFAALDVLIESPGGNPDAAFQIANLIRQHSDSVAAVVPFWCKSAGTMLGVSMDEFVLGELAQLGPLDTHTTVKSDRTSPRQLSSLEMIRAMREIQNSALTLWKLAAQVLIEDEELNVHGAYELASGFVGHVCGKNFSPVQLEQYGESVRNLEITKNYTESLLRRYRNVASPELVATKLVEGYASHSCVIDLPELKDLGLAARNANAAEAPILHDMTVSLLPFYQVEQDITQSRAEMIELVTYVPTPEPKVAISGDAAATADAVKGSARDGRSTSTENSAATPVGQVDGAMT